MNGTFWAFGPRGRPARSCRACGGVPEDPQPEEGDALETILELAASGFADKQIARSAGLAFQTVRNVLERHYQRSGVACRAGAVAAWLLSPGCTDAQRDRVRRRLAGEAVAP